MTALAAITTKAHKAIKIGMVNYDSAEGVGLGAHWENRKVWEHGFVALMRPKDFLYVVNKIRKARTHKVTGGDHMQFVRKYVRDGKPIAAPRIILEIKDDKIKVISHEGRHRATSILAIQPNKDIMVHVIVRKSDIGKGCKGITRELIKDMSWKIEPQDKYDKTAMRPVFMFRHIFWKNESGKVEKVV